MQVPVLLYSYKLLGAGLGLSLTFNVLLLFRLIDRVVLPPATTSAAVIFIAPLGQNALALLALGTFGARGACAQ